MMTESEEEKRKNENLIKWASSQGVVCDAVKPTSLPGRGRGMVAMRKLNKGEQVIHVPAGALLAVDSDTPFLSKHAHQVKKCSLHGRIAANLLCALVMPNHRLLPWTSVVPNLQEIKDCMPVFWPQELQQSLPESALSLLRKQQDKLFSDLNIVSQELLPTIAADDNGNLETLREVYMQAWMLVNSRCFYWDYEYSMPSLRDGEQWPSNWKRPKARQRTKGRPRDDCMALCPVIDCFNHSAEESCAVTFDDRGFFVTCVRDCEPGEELYVTYGSHSNDYLLVEYGFILDQNSNDHTHLDSVLLPRLTSSAQDHLKDENLLGSYVLDASGICHRTQCALRIMLSTFQKWQRYVSGADAGLKEQKNVDELLQFILSEYRTELETKTKEVQGATFTGGKSGGDTEAARNVALKRWKQIDDILETNMKRLQIK